MKTRLTDRGLKALKPRPKPYDVMDDGARAFGVRVRPTGAITFILYRRFPGSAKPTRRQLGQYPEMSLSEARDTAHDWTAKIRRGLDPSREAEQERKTNIEEERARKANTVEAALQAYFASKAHLRTARAREIEMRRELKPWLDRSMQDIGKADIVALIHGIRADRPGQARVVYRLVKGFFNWAIQTDDFEIEVSPCAKINTADLVGHSEEVDRTLADHEIRAFWRATDTGTLGYPVGSFFRLLLLTGLRRSEVSKASWSEFDRAARRWIVPANRMKGAPGKTRDHLVPLAPAIGDLLDGLPRHPGGDFLFSATAGRKPVSAFTTMKAALDKAMTDELAKEGRAFEDFVIHDLRRTVRTRLSSLGVSGHICERVLAHAQPELERRYNKYAFEAEKLVALKCWHAALTSIVNHLSESRAVA